MSERGVVLQYNGGGKIRGRTIICDEEDLEIGAGFNGESCEGLI